MSVVLAKKNCFKMNVTFGFQCNNNFFFQLYLSINTMLHYFQSIIFSLMKNKPIVDYDNLVKLL